MGNSEHPGEGKLLPQNFPELLYRSCYCASWAHRPCSSSSGHNLHWKVHALPVEWRADCTVGFPPPTCWVIEWLCQSYYHSGGEVERESRLPTFLDLIPPCTTDLLHRKTLHSYSHHPLANLLFITDPALPELTCTPWEGVQDCSTRLTCFIFLRPKLYHDPGVGNVPDNHPHHPLHKHLWPHLIVEHGKPEQPLVLPLNCDWKT